MNRPHMARRLGYHTIGVWGSAPSKPYTPDKAPIRSFPSGTPRPSSQSRSGSHPQVVGLPSDHPGDVSQAGRRTTASGRTGRSCATAYRSGRPPCGIPPVRTIATDQGCAARTSSPPDSSAPSESSRLQPCKARSACARSAIHYQPRTATTGPCRYRPAATTPAGCAVYRSRISTDPCARTRHGTTTPEAHPALRARASRAPTASARTTARTT